MRPQPRLSERELTALERRQQARDLLRGGSSRCWVRFAFKLKSSNNEHYRVNPVFGFVEPGAAAEVEVFRYPGPP
ncbi:unnamed protein product [Meloidogyne enterolobii]|uniref:Uncharacterized protein n=1 Tax=Meloidogyne enterolobii TaxID=390850 RepID=A0ACB0ZVE1_MELEN